MKTSTSILVFLAVVFMQAFISCRDDNEEVGTIYSGFMTGYTDSEGYISVLNDDFGKQYMVKEKSGRLKSDTLYRMVASVELDENLNARILQMVPTISDKAYEDSVNPDFKDPVEIKSMYIGSGFLNIHLGIKVAKEGTVHRLFYSHINTPGKVVLAIYHNADDDKPVYTKYAYLSIPLSGYGLSKNDTVFVNAKGYDKDYDSPVIYK